MVKHTELYQQLLKGVENYQRLGSRLIQFGEQAHAFRDFDRVREIGRALSNLPIKSFQSIGYYFLAIAANNLGQGDQEEARRLFERAAGSAPAEYKAKAMLSLAAVSADARDYESELYYYNEIIKVDPLSHTSIEAARGMAIFKACEGYHHQAVKELERLLPLARYAPRHIQLANLNSYAVELSEVGRLEEAKHASSIPVASPLARAYPEWQRTFTEVNQKLQKRRSTVAFSIPEPKPEPEPATEPASEPKLAKIIKFPQPKPAESYKSAEVPALTPIQWLAVMLKVTYGDRSSDEEISRFCAAYLDLVVHFYD